MAFRVEPRESTTPRSAFLIETSEMLAAAASSRCFQPRRARPARICFPEIIVIGWVITVASSNRKFPILVRTSALASHMTYLRDNFGLEHGRVLSAVRRGNRHGESDGHRCWGRPRAFRACPTWRSAPPAITDGMAGVCGALPSARSGGPRCRDHTISAYSHVRVARANPPLT